MGDRVDPVALECGNMSALTDSDCIKARSARMAVRRSFLAGLHCPYCGAALDLILGEPNPFSAETAGGIQFGVLECACGQYPIVEGIPILQKVDGLPQVISSIKERNFRWALLQALNVFRVRWARNTRWHQLLYHRNCRRLVSAVDLCFEEAAAMTRRPKVFSDYLVHRYANPSFLAAIGPMLLLAGLARFSKPGPAGQGRESSQEDIQGPIILDLGCGAGHASFLIGLLHPELSIVSADQDFVNVYLAKRFLAPRATAVCLDVEFPSPFPDNSFDAVFCLDAFHYFKSKKAVVCELERTVKPHAPWLFPHLHNALQENITAGIPLSPTGYLDCFGSVKPRLIGETSILDSLRRQRPIDFGAEWTPERLRESQTLTLVAGPTELWRSQNGFPAALCRRKSSLTINPIYRQQKETDGGISLVLSWPNRVMAHECSGAEEVLPHRVRLAPNELACLRAGRALDASRLADLVSQFVLVPLPSRYAKSDRHHGEDPGNSGASHWFFGNPAMGAGFSKQSRSETTT